MKDTLIYKNACEEGQEFLDTQSSLEEAWNNCTNSNWMLWALEEINYNNESALRLFACACVRETPLADGRKVWDLLADSRSREAVEVAEKFARGEATQEELDAASAVAVAVAFAVAGDAYAYASVAAARAAARAAAAFYAASVYADASASASAYAAASSSSSSSSSVAASDAAAVDAFDAWAAAFDAASEFQANLLRQMIGNPFVVNSISESE